jgi:steroid delta-isomerase-like uncharacterized protein
MTRKEIEAICERRQKAQNDHDVEAFVADYAEDCVVESPLGGRHTGGPAIRKVVETWFKGFPDQKVQFDRLLVDGNLIAQIGTMEGTDLGGLLGMPATGKSFRTPVVFILEIKDRQIVREQRIYDFTGVLIQVGLLKAKPI